MFPPHRGTSRGNVREVLHPTVPGSQVYPCLARGVARRRDVRKLSFYVRLLLHGSVYVSEVFEFSLGSQLVELDSINRYMLPGGQTHTKSGVVWDGRCSFGASHLSGAARVGMGTRTFRSLSSVWEDACNESKPLRAVVVSYPPAILVLSTLRLDLVFLHLP